VIKSFRLRLTAWHVLFLSLLLAGFSGFLYILLARSLEAHLDGAVAGTADMVVTLFGDEMKEVAGDAAQAATGILREVVLPSVSVAIFDANGKLLDASEPLRGMRLPLTTDITRLDRFGSHGGKVTARPCVWNGRRFTLVVVEPLDTIAAQLQAVRRTFYIALPFAVLVAAVGAFLLASKSIAPVVSIAEQAEFITDSNLDTRLAAPGASREFARLASVFNELLARLHHSFERLRAFTADASHELRTPLAIICGEADVALAQNREPAEYRESLAVIQDEARRLTRLVEDLLNLARADAGHQQLHLEEIYLNDVLEECARPALVQAKQKGVQLAASASPDIPFRGDPELLPRMISNLLDNAIRYTPAGGRVEARLEEANDQVRVLVSDNGIGIPPEALGKIFERFYRVDKARSRAAGGFGLGLSIVKWIAEAHQGTVEVNSRPGEGTTFSVRLPRAATTESGRDKIQSRPPINAGERR
jgi:heavy metal sensor kinase